MVHLGSLAGQKVRSLRWHLLLLVIGAMIPVIVFSALLVRELVQRDRHAGERRLLQASRTLAASMDQEVEITIRALEVLAQSESLLRHDLTAFHANLGRVQTAYPNWLTILLHAADGKIILNSRKDYPKIVQEPADQESLAAVIATKKPVIGNIATGPGGRLGFPVRLPIMLDGKLNYILTAVIPVSALQVIVRPKTAPDEEWVRVLVDQRSMVAARSRSPELYVGKLSTPSFQRQIANASEGLHQQVTLEGKLVYLGFSRSPLTGWSAAVAVPREVFEGPTRQSMGMVAGFSAIFLFIFGTLALYFARRIAGGIESAARAADALASGETPEMHGSRVAEIERLRFALVRSASLLAQRQAELTQNLEMAQLARSEAESASHAKDQFLAMLGHELRNPIGAISNGVYLMRALLPDEVKEEKDIKTVQEIMERQLKHIIRLIDDLLDASRIMRGKVHIELAPINMRELIENVKRDFLHLANEAGVTLNIDPSHHQFWVDGDEMRLSQCLGNIVHNAIKFTPSGGSISMKLSSCDDAVFVSIEDTGSGIEAEVLPTLFEPFVQGPQSSDRSRGGLGLGLAVVKGIVKLHGGTITAASPGRGMGTRIEVTLPKGLLAMRVEAKTEESRKIRKKILIIEDQDDVSFSLRRLLEFQGHDVRIARTGKEGIETAGIFEPEAVICDIGLPDIDGIEVCKRLRKTPRFEKINLIALSGYGQVGDKERALAAGFDHHLTKPADLSNLSKALDS